MKNRHCFFVLRAHQRLSPGMTAAVALSNDPPTSSRLSNDGEPGVKIKKRAALPEQGAAALEQCHFGLQFTG